MFPAVSNSSIGGFGTHAFTSNLVNNGTAQLAFSNAQGRGSRIAVYRKTTAEDASDGKDKITSISAMTPYKTKNHEELRWEDYSLTGAPGLSSSASVKPDIFGPAFPSLTSGTASWNYTGPTFTSNPLQFSHSATSYFPTAPSNAFTNSFTPFTKSTPTNAFNPFTTSTTTTNAFSPFTTSTTTTNAFSPFTTSTTTSNAFSPFTTPSATNAFNSFTTSTPSNAFSPFTTSTPSNAFSPFTTSTPTNTFSPFTTSTPTNAFSPFTTSTPTNAFSPFTTPTTTTSFSPFTTPRPTNSFSPFTTPTTTSLSPFTTPTTTTSFSPFTTPTPTNAVSLFITSTPTNAFSPFTTPTPANSFSPFTTPTPANSFSPFITPTPANSFSPFITPTPANSFSPFTTPTPANSFSPFTTSTPTTSFSPFTTSTPANPFSPFTTSTPTNSFSPFSFPTSTTASSVSFAPFSNNLFTNSSATNTSSSYNTFSPSATTYLTTVTSAPLNSFAPINFPASSVTLAPLNQNAASQMSSSQITSTEKPSSVANPFGVLPPSPRVFFDGYQSKQPIQYGISTRPVKDKPAPVKYSLLTTRHLSGRIKLPVRKYDPKTNAQKIPYFSDIPVAAYVPRENPRALVIRPEKWPPIATRENIHDDKDDTTKEEPSILDVPAKLEQGDYYTQPEISELEAKERGEPGYCRHVKDFVVGRHGYGSIKFLGETDVRNVDIETDIQFNNREVIVYMDDSKKPPVGEGLNKPAEITLLHVKCFDKKTGMQHTDGSKVMKYTEMLKKKAVAQGAEFVSYDPVEGEWKFRVQHF